MEKIKGFAIELDLDHLSVDRGLRGLKDNLRTVNSEMRRNMSAFDRSDRSVEKYETRLQGLNKKLEVQKAAVGEARKEYEKMVEQHGHGSKEAEKAAREYNNQAASLSNLERYIERTKDELVKFEREQRIANSSFTKLGDKLEKVGGKLETAGKKMGAVGSTLTQKITKPAVGALSALGSLAVFKGFQRLIGIDTARAQLVALGHSAENVDQIMDAALASVKGTSFGLDEAATTAASAVAAGVDPAKDLEKYLSLAADTASVANVPFNEMGDIFNKVQTSGKAQNDVLRQLSKRGIPIYQYLAETIGKGTDEIEKMARDGKISTKDFLKAVEKNIGGASKIIGEESFAAAAKNIGSDIGRIGANFLDAGGKGGGFFSKLKPMLVDFRGWLEKAEEKSADLGEKFGQAFENMIDKTKALKKRYDDLSPAQQNFVNKVLLLAPAVAIGIGPAISLFGKLTTGVGGVLSVAGKLSKAIGVARGAGLAASLASLGPLAVGGVAVAGVAALSYGIVQLTKDQEGLHEISTERIDKMYEEADSLEVLVKEYDELKKKSQASTDEFARMIDIQKDLAVTQSPDRVERLQKEYDGLLEKSGLNNEEFLKMYELNDEIVKQSPAVEKSFSDKGHEIVESTGAVKEYINSLREMAWIELEIEKTKALENEAALRKENIRIAEELAVKEKEINELMAMRNMTHEEIEARVEEINDMFSQGLVLEEEQYELDRERHSLLQIKRGTLLENLTTMQEERNALIEQRDLNDEQIAQLGEINTRMAEILLAEVDINLESGKGVTTLYEKIEKLKEERDEIVKNMTEEEYLSGEYAFQLTQLDESIKKHESVRDRLKDEVGYQSEHVAQQEEINKKTEKQKQLLGSNYIEQEKNNRSIEAAKKKAEEMNKELGKDVDKTVDVKTNPTTTDLDKKLSSPIRRMMNIVEQRTGLKSPAYPAYADGTNYHPGGPAVIGEKGSELVRLPSGQSFISPNSHTLLDLPKGTHVIPHQETKRIIRNAPHYADGTDGWASSLGNSEFARLLSLNNRASESTVIVHSNSDNSMKELLKETIKQNDYLQKMLDLLMSLLDKDFEAVLAFEPFYNAVKSRMNEDEYSRNKQRRRQ